MTNDKRQTTNDTTTTPTAPPTVASMRGERTSSCPTYLDPGLANAGCVGVTWHERTAAERLLSPTAVRLGTLYLGLCLPRRQQKTRGNEESCRRRMCKRSVAPVSVWSRSVVQAVGRGNLGGAPAFFSTNEHFDHAFCRQPSARDSVAANDVRRLAKTPAIPAIRRPISVPNCLSTTSGATQVTVRTNVWHIPRRLVYASTPAAQPGAAVSTASSEQWRLPDESKTKGPIGLLSCPPRFDGPSQYPMCSSCSLQRRSMTREQRLRRLQRRAEAPIEAGARPQTRPRYGCSSLL
ncbi:hypothetical protein F4824DRAFT_503753 [Ustulina deusta]|nr:hypothetical protein F4824DRAFT_503753 [Ustulina deusta]